MSALWVETLAEFEKHLDTQYHLFERGDLDAIQEFVVPDGLGPLPDHLEDYANTLNTRSLALIASIEDLAGDMGRQLRGLRQRPRFGETTQSSFSFQA
jgi:hypothetical protein